MYVPVHLHTSGGSIGDSIVKIPELIKKAKELNIPSLCITNHGSMADSYYFYSECKQNNINPIIGCEVYTTKDRTKKEKEQRETGHLILLAKNNIGYENLLKILADSELTGFYYKPRTDYSFLKETDTTGLICTTACVGSDINKAIISGDIDNAKQIILELNDIFEDLFLEIQPGEFEEQKIVNEELIKLSSQLKIPLIASNDIHYLNKEDYIAHDGHVKTNRKKKLSDDLIYPDKCYYLMSEEELKESFSKDLNQKAVEAAIQNTMYLNEICKIDLQLDELNLPEFVCPDGFEPKSYLEYISLNELDKIKHRIKDVAAYTSRAYKELKVIDMLGFTSYFLIVRDFMEFARNKNIPYGPGRGSVCGSLIAYLCGITSVDPIKYDLLFDRFLSEHRIGSIPDVDMDFSSTRRKEMFDYAVEKYGADHCAAVSTAQMRKARSAIKDAARLLELEVGEEISKLIPMTHYDAEGDKMTDLSISQSLDAVKELRDYRNIYPELFEMAIKLEGLPRAASIHAAGTLISKTDLTKLVPMIKKEDSLLNATSFDLTQAEQCMLVKYDFLGIATLSTIDEVKKQKGDIFDRSFSKYDDEKIWDLICSKNTTGLFQISSKTYKKRMKRLNPRNIDELAAVLALVRGPCISAGTDETYMKIVEGTEAVELLHPVYDDAVRDTNGIMIFQEQLMQCCNNFGLPLHVCYDIMKVAAKKKLDKLETYREQLWELGKKNHNMSKEVFERIFKIIVDSGLYSFNKSHAVAYAILCYETAYYMTHYPKEYLSAELTTVYETAAADKKKEKVLETVKECRRRGIKFLPLDINKSKWSFIPEEDGIRIGMCAISAFGEKAYKALESLEGDKDIENIYNNIPKQAFNKKSFNALIFSGTFGDIENDYKVLCDLREEEPAENIVLHASLKFSIYESDEELEEKFLGCNFIHSYLNDMKTFDTDDIKPGRVFSCDGVLSRVTKKKDKNKKMMAWLSIESGGGTLETVVFANQYETYKKFLKKDEKVNIKLKKDKSGDGYILVSVQ